MGYVQPKYMRKFAFDSMIGLEVPESVADFIEGRVPKRVGAKHYMALRKQADRFYKKYAKVLRCRIKAKMRTLRHEISFLESAGISVTKNCNHVTENCNHEINSNQVVLTNLSENVGAPAGIRTRAHGVRGRNT